MTDIEPILERLGLLQYYEVFIEEGFETWDTLLDVQETDLEALGVKRGHRRRLQRAIAEYRGYSSDRPLGSPSQDTPGQDFTKLEAGLHQNIGGKEQPASATAEPKRKYRRHPKPDENAPDKPPSAYVLFSNKIRDEVRNENLSFTETARLVGERWQKLDPAEKEAFESYAASLKETYNSQLAEYKKTDAYREYAQYLADFKAKHGPINEAKVDSKRLKLEGEPGNPWMSSSTVENVETASHMFPHVRGGSGGPLPSISQGVHGTTGPASLHVLTSLPNINVADRRRLSPSRQAPYERHLHRTMSGQESVSEESTSSRTKRGGFLSQSTALRQSPPMIDTPPPPLRAMRRNERPDLSYGRSSPTWPRQGTGSYAGSVAPSESPTKTFGTPSLSTSPEEIQRERLQDFTRASHGTLSPPHRPQQQQQTPVKGSLPISDLVGPNVSPDTNVSTSQRILPLPYTPTGSHTQSTSTMFGQPAMAGGVSTYQTRTERGPLPQRYASSIRKRSDDEAADDATDASEAHAPSRARRPR